MKLIRAISNELIEIMEYKNPRICFNDYKLEDIENYCVFKEIINPFQLYAELQRKDNIINELKNGIKKLDDMFYETFRISQDGYFSISEWELKDFTDKINELEKVE